MAGRRPSAARRTRTWRAAGACRARSGGPASSSRARCPTRSSRTRTCCRRCSRRPASPTSSRSSRRATRRARRPSRSTSTATTCCRAGRARRKTNPRRGFFYWSDDGDLMALRFDNWKAISWSSAATGMGVWQEPFVPLRFPKIFNLRSDPFERGDVDGSMFYEKWLPIACSCSYRPRRSSANSSRRSRSSHRARSRQLQHRRGAGKGRESREAPGHRERRGVK